jgi:hypothetical protein
MSPEYDKATKSQKRYINMLKKRNDCCNYECPKHNAKCYRYCALVPAMTDGCKNYMDNGINQTAINFI